MLDLVRSVSVLRQDVVGQEGRVVTSCKIFGGVWRLTQEVRRLTRIYGNGFVWG